jgi:hypothetical protein
MTRSRRGRSPRNTFHAPERKGRRQPRFRYLVSTWLSHGFRVCAHVWDALRSCFTPAFATGRTPTPPPHGPTCGTHCNAPCKDVAWRARGRGPRIGTQLTSMPAFRNVAAARAESSGEVTSSTRFHPCRSQDNPTACASSRVPATSPTAPTSPLFGRRCSVRRTFSTGPNRRRLYTLLEAAFRRGGGTILGART